MDKKIKVGVSACLLGEQVRFDGGHKMQRFVVDQLSEMVEFTPVCPEVAIGMSIPRPAIRLVSDEDRIKLVLSKDNSIDFTDKMIEFSEKKTDQLSDLCGYVLCSKSPTCGMERVVIYPEKGGAGDKSGIGMYANILMKKIPWLPVEEDGRLNDPVLRENFVTRIFALQDLYTSVKANLTPAAFVNFHSRYKLMLMANCPEAYKELGVLVANIKEYDLEEFFVLYRQKFMDGIKERASKKNHTNTLMHIQGYFKKSLTSEERQELASVIESYRLCEVPLLAPLTLMAHYLKLYPNEYLASQVYLNPHPKELKLRYSL
ncbi:2-thiouracil desulfurase family protein [Vibrio sp. SS-MA-C1-2]|uniref:YbgA family protein n=1 Tax=Vibrio sp. SS-MA-C1-2 TaxID=2908646 RepID=UPI001F36E2FB|nr:DUF523 and DUF1722 domain-containing protein [Vibrio sp. SS-MA-C1-2]UJF16967.1 2-thiouracil desulfurase family protein [Vibrio sp. SS-MA-C1-2]